MSTSSMPPESASVSHSGPMMYMSTSAGGRTPATIIAVGAVFAVLPAITVALRFYTRLSVTRFMLSVDDWLMLAAFVLTLGMGLMLIIGASIHGLGQPTPQGWAPGDYFWVTDDALIITEKIFWVFIMTQALAFGLVKLSILYFYRRIFPSQTFSILSGILIVLVGIWGVGFFFAYMFRCGTNFWALWAPLMYLLEHCYDSKPMFCALGISDVITDFMILSLPWYWIWKLNMSAAKRMAIAGVFLLGFLVIAAGIARLVIFIQQTSDWVQTADGNGLLTTMMVWSMIEMGIAVIAGCLPTIWPLISKASLEDMMRTVRSVLSLESLRNRSSTKDSTGSTSLESHRNNTSSDIENKTQKTFQESNHSVQLPLHGQSVEDSPNVDVHQKDGIKIGVKKDVTVFQRPFKVADAHLPPGVNDGSWDLQVQTDTRVSSNKKRDDNIV